MADGIGRRDVEEQCAGCAAPAVLEHLHRQCREGPAGTQFLQLEAEQEARIPRSQKDHVGRDDATPRRVTSGSHDGLPEHLAALDDGSPTIAASDADKGAIIVSLHVEQFDQVRGVSPRRKPLDGDVTVLVSRSTVDDLDAHPDRVKGTVSGKPVEPLRRPADPPQDLAPVGADRIGCVPRRRRRTQEWSARFGRRVDAQELDLAPHRARDATNLIAEQLDIGCRPAGSRAWPVHPRSSTHRHESDWATIACPHDARARRG